ncbi:MAG: efflux RND transporter permease subunit [Planctomycetota bacterium]|nr:efflux RND transporter permease subunit [Planctomycetota bacterium]
MIRFLAVHPTAANLLMVCLIALGVLALPSLTRESMPDVTPPELEIRVLYPGATATEVEEAICTRVEDALDGIRNLEEVRSEAREGQAVIVAEMTEDKDFAAFQDDVRTEVDAIDDFPDGVEDPIITVLGREDLVFALLVSGPLATTDLKDYCEDLKERIQRIPAVSKVEIRGFSDRQLRVSLERSALRQYGLSVADVRDRIAGQSVDMPAGLVETRDGDQLLRFVEQRRTPGELESLVIVSEDSGAEVRLGDISRIVDRFENDESKVEVAGRRAGLLEIMKVKSDDALRVGSAARELIEAERKRHPQIDYQVTRDTTVGLRDQIDLVVTNGWQGMVLVFFTMWLFFAFRLAGWVVFGLPVSMLGALFVLPAIGITINFMSLIAFLLALGLLMDDAIVIAENIARHRRDGKDAFDAAVAGVSEVKIGVFSSFLTTVCILGPLAFLSGQVGRTLEVVPIVLIVVLSVSLIEAFFILPAHLAHSLHKQKEPGRFRRRFDAGFDWVRETLLGGTVDRFVRWRYLVVGSVIGVFMISIGMLASGRLAFEGMPPIEGDIMVARVLLPQGSPQRRTQAVVKRLEDALARVDATFTPRQPDGRKLVKRAFTQYGQNSSANENGPHVATVYVDLLTAEDRSGSIQEFLRAWREEAGSVPGVIQLVIGEPAAGPSGQAIEVRFAGSDLQRCKAAADETRAYYRRFVGVSNLLDDLRPGKPERRLRLAEGAYRLGLDAQRIAQQVSAAYRGATAYELQRGRESYEIDVRLRESDRDSMDDFSLMRVQLPDGTAAPLEAVANVVPGRGWARIARIDGVRTVTLIGDVDTTVAKSAAINAAMQRELLPQLAERYPGLDIALAGEAEESAKSSQSMVTSMILGLFGVFLLLSFQFRSYIEPVVVMVAIPFAFIGVIWGHVLVGLPFTLPSLLGFIALSGVVVNDSILLVEFLKARRREGIAAEDAASAASRMRFRAVLLTSATTIAGLLPLLAERSLQARIIQPIAVSTAFGIAASTLLVLAVLPCLYVILDDFGVTERVSDAH